MNIGNIIRDIREKMNITQKELSEGVCSEHHIYRLEKGKRAPSYIILTAILSRLDYYILIKSDTDNTKEYKIKI